MNKINKILLIAIVILFLLCVSLSVIIFIHFNLLKETSKQKIELSLLFQNEKLKNTDSDNDGLSDFDEIYVYKTNPNDADTDKDGLTDDFEINKGFNPLLPEITVKVDWEKQLIEQKQEQKCGAEEEECHVFIAGKITDEPYKNYILYLEARQFMGWEFKHLIIKDDQKLYLEDNNIKIKGVSDLPEEIFLPGTNYKLKKYSSPNLLFYPQLFGEIKIIKKLFAHDKLGDFYLIESGCIATKLPDQTGISYGLEIPFINKESGLLDITFNNGEKNKEEYDYYGITGCGAWCISIDEIDEKELNPKQRLKISGKTSAGENIYEFKDINDEYLKKLYNEEFTLGYNKYSYKEFIGLHPLLYWKDPFNRWIQFRNKKFMTLAEICKPVIYLYPEKEVEMNIKVEPSGGFSLTVPEYNNGWNVKASQDGKIKDLKTGKEYDYLYWEGIGLNYPIKNEGWVVEKENLDQFFDKKLSLLGLNEKEIYDFKDYWVKRLSSLPYPYYKISFLRQCEFNELAPLYFSPVRPATVIRVMMTAQGLNQFESIPEQKLLKVPKRQGFTVVEWGGTLLK